MFFLLTSNVWQAAHYCFSLQGFALTFLSFSFIYQMEWSMFVKTSLLSIYFHWILKAASHSSQAAGESTKPDVEVTGISGRHSSFSNAWSRSLWQEATGPMAAYVLTHVTDLMLSNFVQRASYFRICLLTLLLRVTQTTWLPLVVSACGGLDNSVAEGRGSRLQGIHKVLQFVKWFSPGLCHFVLKRKKTH